MPRPRHLRAGLTACVVLACAVARGAGPRPFEFRTAALSDQPAPGTETGTTYGDLSFTTPTINGAGQVSFFTFLAGPSVDNGNSTALYAGAPGSVALVARLGDHAPGTPPDVAYGNFGFQALMNDAGVAAFEAQLKGPSVGISNLRGLFAGPVGSPALLAREGDPAPGTSAGVVYQTLQSSITSSNNTGQVAFVGSVTGPGVNANGNANDNFSAAWVGTQGNVTLLARQGDPAPGAPAGTRYGQLYMAQTGPRLNNAGEVVYTALFASGGSGVFFGTPGSVQMVVREGDVAPGTGGQTFSVPAGPTLNDRGDIAFTSFVSSGKGIWAGQPGALQLIALGGMQAPGAPAGVKLGTINVGAPTLGPTGAVAFQAQLDNAGPNAGGVFAGQPGSIRLIARTGDAVTGEGPGVNYADIVDYSAGPAINAAGDVAFLSTLAGTGVTTANDQAIFLARPDGTVATVVREGDPLDVGGGVLRTVRTLNFAGPGTLDDAGEVTFGATFTDGTNGVFVAVPEPTAAVLALVAGTMLMRRRRRRAWRRAGAVVGLALACAAGAPAARAAAPVTVVAATGRAAPGTEAGTAFGALDDRVAINAAGGVVFGATLTGPGITADNANALWTTSGGAPQLAARAGTAAPGAAAGATFSHFFYPDINAAGDVAFLADLRNASTRADAGIWSGRPGALAPVAVEGSIAPGGPQAKPFVVDVFSTGEFWTPMLNTNGNVAFRGLVGDPDDVFSNRSGIWTNAPGALTQVAREGTPAPADPGGAAFTFLRRPAINAAGTLLFSGQTNAGGDLYVGDATAQAPAVVRGQTPVPGVPGATFTSAFNQDPSLNAAGQVTFPGTIEGPGVTGNNNQGIWAGPPAALRLVARTGDVAPGLPGTTLAQFGQPFISRNGQAAFTGIVVNGAGESGSALFVGDRESSLTLVALDDAHAPGTPDGVVFSGVGDPALNAAGDVAFLGHVRGPGVTSVNQVGIWEGNASALHLVARQGDVLDIDGTPKTIQFLGLTVGAGGEDGRATGLNDAGQVAYYAHFTDGTDAVLVTPVPEPPAAVSAVMGLTLPALRRRRTRSRR